MRNKYHSRKITRDGETFDSIKEYRRWCELKLMVKAGAIADLQRQVKFELIPSQRIDGKVVERPVTYIADFVYSVPKEKTITQDISSSCGKNPKSTFLCDSSGEKVPQKGKCVKEYVVEDTKGFKTKDYIIKRKLMLWVHGTKIREV